LKGELNLAGTWILNTGLVRSVQKVRLVCEAALGSWEFRTPGGPKKQLKFPAFLGSACRRKQSTEGRTEH
jgi:hypothetical protein